jgi:photosystem II stability/assembly factor-like uncharacterized protein
MKQFTFVFTFLIILSDTSNIQAQWTYIANSSNNMQHACFVNSQIGFVCGGTEMYKTTDGGTNWQGGAFTTWGGYLSNIVFVNQSTGFCGLAGANYSGANGLYKTTDTGISWYNINNNQQIQFLNFINDNTGWALSGTIDNYIMHTTNGGLNWIAQSSVYPFLSSISFADANTGVVCGRERIIHTNNGGLNWTIDTILNRSLITVAFENNLTGFIGGFDGPSQTGRLMKTTNGGSNWFDLPAPQKIQKICIVDTSHIWAACYGTDSGYIYFSSDNGLTWRNQRSIFNPVSDVFMVNQVLGFAVAYNDGIYKTTNGGNPIGISPISSVIPKSFNLSQNYPNPFNPSTLIEFDIPKSSFTKLIIYDINGRVIQTLVNQELKAGSYKADFDGTNLSSGLYFYELKTGDFTQTRKMVLLK